VKALCFVFIAMGVYGLLYDNLGGCLISFGMAGFVAYGDRKMLREEAKGDTGSDRDSLG